MKDLFNMADYYTNELLQRRPLEEISIINNLKYSLLEKTSVKLLPIIKTILWRMAYEEGSVNSSNSVSPLSNTKSKPTVDDPDADMKNLLGYLN